MNKNIMFQRYKRGSLVMVNFSPSIGSEIKGNHFAIVLNKKDSPNSSVLTVIPISSKNKPYYVNIGNFLVGEIYPYISKQLEEFEDVISNLNDDSNKKQVETLMNNLKEISKVINLYKSKDVDSFAMVQNITTISKLRVLKPINKYDPILNIKVSNEIMNKLDEKLKELYCK